MRSAKRQRHPQNIGKDVPVAAALEHLFAFFALFAPFVFFVAASQRKVLFAAPPSDGKVCINFQMRVARPLYMPPRIGGFFLPLLAGGKSVLPYSPVIAGVSFVRCAAVLYSRT